ncbi:MAG: branched-chain amino acid ABC transporter permease [Burkholderiales bacterium]|nr:branched-chain amino acid ABC transporter permease [Burkholderiales bacterium]MDE2397104.1 branched-chain amino acid ABC transporter permease [Burkholderiales bacterium]MDE2452682.1 branched-chain amino acid ABC transporter permease [Burkholderiales bacterium]
MDASTLLISLLNGLSTGLLLFMLASGLTLIFSMMGVLNFAHASFYMLGAYVACTIAQVAGFWWGLLLAPLVVGCAGAAFERYALRRVHRFGHVPELLITFGLSYIVLELVQLVWGRQALEFLPPESLRGPVMTIIELPGHLAFAWGAPPPECKSVATAVCTQFPSFRAFGMGVAVAMLVAVWLLFTRTRIGLVIQSALTHPEMAEALGHNVPRVFMLVFGGGTALAALAGVIGGAMQVTEPGMAQAVGAVVFAVIVIGGMGSLAGAFAASVLLGVLNSFAVSSDRSLLDLFHALNWAAGPDTPGYALWSVKISQVAAILPYLLLVLILIFRPKGLLGTREG